MRFVTSVPLPMLSTSPLSLPLPSDTNDKISDGMRSTRSFLHPSSSFQIPIEFSHLDPRFFRPIPLDPLPAIFVDVPTFPSPFT